MKNLLASLLCFFSSTIAKATTYYISENGNDLSNGTSISTPWKTIAKVNSRLFLPGDNILFKRCNMWREQLTLSQSGTATKPITFSAYGIGEKPVINGANITTGWVGAGANLWSITSPNITTSRAMVIVNDSVFTEALSFAALGPGKYFIDLVATPDKLYIWSATNPNTRTIEISKRDWCIRGVTSKVKYVIFRSLDCRYAGYAGIALYGTYNSQYGGYCKVDSCNFYANRSFGCVAYDGHKGDIFSNSTASWNGNGFYSMIADSLTISHCSTSHTVRHFVSPNFTDGHGYGGYDADEFTVENSESNDDSYGVNVDAKLDSNNATIRYNYFHDSKPGTSGIGMGNLAKGGIIKIYYNLVVNCGGVTEGASLASYSVNNGTVLVYNNTFYNNTSNGIGGTVNLRYAGNYIFKNNIVSRDYVDYVKLYKMVNTGLPQSDYNQFYVYNPGKLIINFFYSGTNYNTLPVWKSGTLRDIHGQYGDPLFNSASDFRLKASSPCINKGVNVGLTKDILGNPIVGLPDIGAYEHY